MTSISFALRIWLRNNPPHHENHKRANMVPLVSCFKTEKINSDDRNWFLSTQGEHLKKYLLIQNSIVLFISQKSDAKIYRFHKRPCCLCPCKRLQLKDKNTLDIQDCSTAHVSISALNANKMWNDNTKYLARTIN